MRLLTSLKARTPVLRTLAATAVLATAVTVADPAHASLSGNDWTARTLPANYYVDSSPRGEQPVSCARGTGFCLAIVQDSATPIVNSRHLEAALASTDAGQTWTGYAPLPSAFRAADGISCVSASVCWVSGVDQHGEPQVIHTADGGKTWADPSPAAWANVDWVPNGIACASASTCWLAGLNGPFGNMTEPMLLRTTDSGATWKTFTNLPPFTPAERSTGYWLNGISCVSARSCVAVGVDGTPQGDALAITTSNGGITWRRSQLSGVNWLSAISCIPAGWMHVCYASGGTYSGTTNESRIVRSLDGGLDWRIIRTSSGAGGFTALNSISCGDASHCWVGLNGVKAETLVGTANAGASWSSVASDMISSVPSVSCLSIRVCVATVDNGLWVTTDDGGLREAGQSESFGRLTR